MELMKKIGDDLKQAMLDKDKNRVAALRMIRSEVVKKEKEKGSGSLKNEDILGVIQSLIRRAEDSIEQFKKGGRDDLVEAEVAQLDTIKSYLPEKIPVEEIQRVVDETIKEMGALSRRDMGKVMGAVMGKLKETKKLVDGKEVKDIVITSLSKLEEE